MAGGSALAGGNSLDLPQKTTIIPQIKPEEEFAFAVEKKKRIPQAASGENLPLTSPSGPLFPKEDHSNLTIANEEQIFNVPAPTEGIEVETKIEKPDAKQYI